MRGQAANAISAWEKWNKDHPGNAGALAVLGNLEDAVGDKKKAEFYYNRALEIKPDQPVAANNLAYMLLQSGGNVDLALSLAQAARRGMPDSPDSADTLAWAYYYKGTYGYARDLLEDALKKAPNNAAMHYHLGMVYSKMADRNSALLHLKKAISIAPGSQTAKDAQAALQKLG
jgi:Flp pilus assembly protein TadD